MNETPEKHDIADHGSSATPHIPPPTSCGAGPPIHPDENETKRTTRYLCLHIAECIYAPLAERTGAADTVVYRRILIPSHRRIPCHLDLSLCRGLVPASPRPLGLRIWSLSLLPVSLFIYSQVRRYIYTSTHR